MFLLLHDGNLLRENSVYTIRSNDTTSVNDLYIHIF